MLRAHILAFCHVAIPSSTNKSSNHLRLPGSTTNRFRMQESCALPCQKESKIFSIRFFHVAVNRLQHQHMHSSLWHSICFQYFPHKIQSLEKESCHEHGILLAAMIGNIRGKNGWMSDYKINHDCWLQPIRLPFCLHFAFVFCHLRAIFNHFKMFTIAQSVNKGKWALIKW